MIRYLETLLRRRVLFAATVVVALLVTVGLQALQPRVYESSANIRFDQSVGGDTFNGSLVPAQTAADREVLILRELLRTHAFTQRVGRDGQLSAYLADHDQGSGILGSALRTVGLGGASGSLEDRVYAALNSEVSLTATGPEVVGISVSGPTAEVATRTTQAFIDQFSSELQATQQAKLQATADYYGTRVKSDQADVTGADQQLTTYLAAHPKAVASGPQQDLTAGQLARAADAAEQRYVAILDKYDQALIAVSNVAGTAGFRVVDRPTVPIAPVGLLRKLLSAVVIGLLVGLLVVAVFVTVLTLTDPTARRADDVGRTLGLRVAGEIRQFPAAADTRGRDADAPLRVA